LKEIRFSVASHFSQNPEPLTFSPRAAIKFYTF